jgi:hypothetical protein
MMDSDRGVAEFVVSAVNSTHGFRLDTGAVLESARARMEEWRSIQAAIPSLEFKPRLVKTLPAPTVTLDQTRWQLVLSIDGRRNLASIARGLGVTPYELRRRMKTLLDDRIIELDPSLPTVPFDGEAARPDHLPAPPEDSGPFNAQVGAGDADGTTKGRRRLLRSRKRTDEQNGQATPDAASGARKNGAR